MSNFLKGLLIGIGLSWLLAPMRGEEMRRTLSSRIQQLRGYLPENTQLSNQTSQIATSLQNYAGQASTQVKDTASKLSDSLQQATSTAKQVGQSVADTTKQSATQVHQVSPANASSSVISTISSENTDTVETTASQKDSLTSIPGMEPEPQHRLEAEGIYTIPQLLAQTSTKEERAALAEKIGMTTNMLRTLIDRADLMRVQGVGGDMATLLEENGVNGCKDLQRRNPEHLHATLLKAQGSSKTAARTPGLDQLTGWIAEASAIVSAS